MVGRVDWAKCVRLDGCLCCPNGENVARTFSSTYRDSMPPSKGFVGMTLPVARRCVYQRIIVEAQRQTARLLPDNSDHHQLQPRAVYANPP